MRANQKDVFVIRKVGSETYWNHHTKDVVGLQISTRRIRRCHHIGPSGKIDDRRRRERVAKQPITEVGRQWCAQAVARWPVFSLSLWSRLAASPFAIVFLLVLPNSFHIGISPAPEFRAVHCDLLRRPNLADRKPAVKSDPVDSRHLRRLLCGIGSH